MTLWLGIMRVAEAAGLVTLLGRALRPVCAGCSRRCRPIILPPARSWSRSPPTCSGLNNAATPLGIKAMEELQALNPDKDTASQCDGHVHGDDHLGRAAHPGDDDRRPGRGGLAAADRDHRADRSSPRSSAPSPRCVAAKILQRVLSAAHRPRPAEVSE